MKSKKELSMPFYKGIVSNILHTTSTRVDSNERIGTGAANINIICKQQFSTEKIVFTTGP